MNRPLVRQYKKPKHISQYPCGPHFTAGYLMTENAGWRTEKPIINKDLCTNCLVCYMSCPDGVIIKTENKVEIDYRFCKGCGICANECKKGAIGMVKEG